MSTTPPTDLTAVLKSGAVGKYLQNVQLKFMQMDNFGLSIDDAGEIKKQQRVFLRDLFVEPHLSSRHLDPEQLINLETKTDVRPDWQSITDVLQQHPHSFILGDPGTGKTTLIHWLMLAFSYSSSNLTKIALGELVPFALILRELPLANVDSFKTLWQVFTEHNQDVMQAFSQYPEQDDVIETLLTSGQALILLDGLDEITHEDTRKRLGKAILEGMRRYPACRFVITSRVVGFDQAQWFGLKELEVELENDKELLKYRGLFNPSEYIESQKLPVSYITPFTYPQAQQFVNNWYQQYQPNHDGNHQQRVTELVTRMQINEGLGRLSRIPVLLNMICFIHARRGRLPNGRAELYQRIAETYLVTLDAARNISPYRGDSQISFDYADRSEWLSALALTMQESRSDDETAILLSKAEVRDILTIKLKELDVLPEHIDDEISFLLRDFAIRSGLFIPRGEGVYGFSHLSFLEYFAAKALRQQAELGDINWADLRKKTKLIWWQETLVLFFEQLEDAKLAAKYLDTLFPSIELKEHETTEEQFTTQLLLAAIVMDSGVKLTLTKRQRVIAELWKFYLQISTRGLSWIYSNYSALAKRLWQADFDAINLGVAAMSAVTNLNLSGVDIVEVLPLAGLMQLQRLNLNRTLIKDVSALTGLAQLKRLELSETPVSDVSALAGLTQLQTLDLDGTAVSDVSALAGLTQLQILYLRETPVSDVSALAGLTQLKIHR
ncbi:MAG: NACHT domain-containing protein [Methylococcales bacterium]